MARRVSVTERARRAERRADMMTGAALFALGLAIMAAPFVAVGFGWIHI